MAFFQVCTPEELKHLVWDRNQAWAQKGSKSTFWGWFWQVPEPEPKKAQNRSSGVLTGGAPFWGGLLPNSRPVPIDHKALVHGRVVPRTAETSILFSFIGLFSISLP